MNNSTNITLNTTSDQSNGTIEIVSILHYSFIAFVCLHLAYFLFMLIKLNFCKEKEEAEDETKMRKINEECSVCLENVTNETQLLCSHSFCATCIYDYYFKNFQGSMIKCPYCRKESKLFVTNFNKTEENKDIYEKLVNYNNAMTNSLKTSLCLCYDMYQFFIFHMKNILNFRNDQYSGQRKCLAFFVILVIIIIIVPISGRNDLFELVGDIIYYLIMIIIIIERFNRRIRDQIDRSNTERRESENQSHNNSQVINQNNSERISNQV